MSNRHCLPAFVTLLVLGSSLALADDWTPEDLVEGRPNADVEARAANVYLHPPALAVQLDSLAVLLVETDLPGGPTEPLLPLSRQWLPGREAPGSFGPGWIAPWDARPEEAPGFERDEAGRIRRLASGPDEVVLEYGDGGRIQAIRGRGAVEFETDGQGRVVAARSSGGRSVRYTYGDGGRLARVEGGAGEFVAYGYDERDRLASIEREDGMRTTLAYHEDGALASLTGPGRALTTFEVRRSAGATFVAVASAAGSARTWEFRPRSGEVFVHGPGELVEEKAYDEAGRLVRHREPDGTVTEFGYDPAGRIARIECPGEPPETFAYDEAGRMVGVESVRGSVRATYGAGGLIETFTDGSGTTRFEYGPDRTLARIVPPYGPAVAVASDAAGRLASLLPEGGVEERFAYDGADRLVSTEGAAGRWEFAYDPKGRLVSVKDPSVGTTRFAYGDHSVAIEGPDGRTIVREWDESGRVVAERVQPGDETRSIERDALGQAVGVRTGSGSKQTFSYDDWGRLAEAAASDGSRMAFEWSPSGLLTLFRRAGGETLRFEYGPAGRLLAAASDQRGRATFEYGGDGRLAVRLDPGRGPRHHAYDGKGRLVEIAIGDSIYRRTFDPEGRVRSLFRPRGGETRVDYDAAGRPARLTDAAGEVAELSYDAAGRPIGRRPPVRETRVTYDGAGRPATFESAGAPARTLTSDAPGRLAGGDTPARRVAYSYDPAGTVNERRDLTSGRTTRYESKAGRWTRATLAGDVVLSASRGPEGSIARLEGPGERPCRSSVTTWGGSPACAWAPRRRRRSPTPRTASSARSSGRGRTGRRSTASPTTATSPAGSSAPTSTAAPWNTPTTPAGASRDGLRPAGRPRTTPTTSTATSSRPEGPRGASTRPAGSKARASATTARGASWPAPPSAAPPSARTTARDASPASARPDSTSSTATGRAASSPRAGPAA